MNASLALPFGGAVSVPDDTDSWCTPQWLADYLPEVDLDPASNAASVIKARRSVCLPDNGLAADWSVCKTLWCNPPYSAPLPWAEMAARHAATTEQLWLIKLDPSTRWWATMIEAGARSYAFRRRVQFTGRVTTASQSNFCCALIHLGPRRGHFDGAIGRMLADRVLWQP